MDIRKVWLTLALVAASPAALAADGLTVPAPENLWPQWQARIAVQSASLSPLTLSGMFDSGAVQRSLQGAAMLGDFYFGDGAARGFRASGGLLVGQQSGAPWAATAAGSRLNLAVNSSSASSSLLPGSEPIGSATYLGLGYTGASARSSWALTADLGMATGRAGAAASVGRAVFGNQGMESALRDMRLTPVFQLGVRYAF